MRTGVVMLGEGAVEPCLNVPTQVEQCPIEDNRRSEIEVITKAYSSLL